MFKFLAGLFLVTVLTIPANAQIGLRIGGPFGPRVYAGAPPAAYYGPPRYYGGYYPYAYPAYNYGYNRPGYGYSGYGGYYRPYGTRIYAPGVRVRIGR